MSAKKDLRLATDWPVSKVRRCLWKKERRRFVEFLAQRHEERFFEPIRLLGNSDKNWQGHGFAMMSLCSLLVETIQSYRDGLPSTFGRDLDHFKTLQNVPAAYRIPAALQANGVGAFRDFFQRFHQELDGIDGEKFYRNVRNGLLHQAQTKGGWKINIRRKRLFAAKTIDRDRFALGLRQSFDLYLRELTGAKWESTVWKNARRKIWWLIHLS